MNHLLACPIFSLNTVFDLRSPGECSDPETTGTHKGKLIRF